MPFKKVDPNEEIEKAIKKDPEIKELIEKEEKNYKDIKDSIKLLKENGYIVKKFSSSMQKASDECEAVGWEGDCCGCPCNICIIQ